MKTELSLFMNACSFLEEAAEKAVKANADPQQWKFAILNLVQAVELSLKERIRQEHPVLIYQNIDAQKKTLSLRDSIVRLDKVCNCKFSEKEISAINTAAKIRDEIVHYEFELNHKRAKIIFSKILSFLAHFFHCELDLILYDYLSAELVNKLNCIAEYSSSLIEAADKIIQDKEYEYIFLCPACGFETFVYEDNINTCLSCGHFEEVYECHDCMESVLASEMEEYQVSDYEFRMYCPECYSHLIDFLESEYEYDQR